MILKKKGNLLDGIVKIVLELREVVYIKNNRITVWGEREQKNKRGSVVGKGWEMEQISNQWP